MVAWRSWVVAATVLAQGREKGKKEGKGEKREREGKEVKEEKKGGRKQGK